MPQNAAGPALPPSKHAHRPEPVEPPSPPPMPPPDPDDPDTVPSPSPSPIDPDEPAAPPIGDPPQEPTQTPQARRLRLSRSQRCGSARPGVRRATRCDDFMYLLQTRRIFYRQIAVVTPRLY